MEVFVKFEPFLFYIGLAVCWSYSQPIIEQTINTSKVIFLLMLRETGIPLLRETGIPLSHSVTQSKTGHPLLRVTGIPLLRETGIPQLRETGIPLSHSAT